MSTLSSQLQRYRWYHRIAVGEGLYTEPVANTAGFEKPFALIRSGLDQFDFRGKSVLDVGCRDGLFSFEAEKRGASEVTGIDNDLSLGATEFLLPHFKSQVRMLACNLYDLPSAGIAATDFVFAFGLLYHLRQPFLALRILSEQVKRGGHLLVETAVVSDARFDRYEFLYCPVERSPYEPTSCTFFNPIGLIATLKGLGLTLKHQELLPSEKISLLKKLRIRWAGPKTPPTITRGFFMFEKTGVIDEKLKNYWFAQHTGHSKEDLFRS